MHELLFANQPLNTQKVTAEADGKVYPVVVPDPEGT